MLYATIILIFGDLSNRGFHAQADASSLNLYADDAHRHHVAHGHHVVGVADVMVGHARHVHQTVLLDANVHKGKVDDVPQITNQTTVWPSRSRSESRRLGPGFPIVLPKPTRGKRAA